MFIGNVVAVLAAAGSVYAGLPITNSQSINTWLRNAALQSAATVPQQHVLTSPKEFKEQFFQQRLDHFSNDTTETFGQRYWVNSRHYRTGGPVIVLDGGETSGEDRLPFLDTGIVDILASATHGLGIVLEHRYYGDSIPVKNFSTDAMRWLSNAQSAEDSAQFIANFKWNGTDLSAPRTKWIYYGGSYAGARAAHMRVLYPDLVFGAIASSAVTHAVIDYWEYNDAIRLSANQSCVNLLLSAIPYIDAILSIPLPFVKNRFKAAFGLEGLEDDDFASVLQWPLGGVQAQNWDRTVSSTSWSRFCDQLGSGYANSPVSTIRTRAAVHNYAQWIKDEIVSKCYGTPVECFGTRDDTVYQDTDLSQTWRAWTWQVCTEWGYFQGAPPDPTVPRIVSNRLTLEYSAKICQQAYPAGKFASVPTWPNVSVVNQLGDFGLAKDRIAFIDGDEDPWRPATPHSDSAPSRADTILRPFKLIKRGVHHWDENGLKDHSKEPEFIWKIHEQEVDFVLAWLKEKN